MEIIFITCMLYSNFRNSHLEPDQVPIFENEIDSAFETFSVMSTVVLSHYHEVIAVRVLQVTGEG
jgi:hypothetical protein